MWLIAEDSPADVRWRPSKSRRWLCLSESVQDRAIAPWAGSWARIDQLGQGRFLPLEIGDVLSNLGETALGDPIDVIARQQFALATGQVFQSVERESRVQCSER